MNVKKVQYSKHIPGAVDHHHIVFLTQSGEMLFTGFFINSGDAKRVAENIMSGKASSSTFVPFPGVFAFEREKYDKDLVDMAKTGELVDCVVVENAAESVEELLTFADKTFRGSS
jgi:hypothetical protein